LPIGPPSPRNYAKTPEISAPERRENDLAERLENAWILGFDALRAPAAVCIAPLLYPYSPPFLPLKMPLAWKPLHEHSNK